MPQTPPADCPRLLFVYNADSGLFNTLADIAHKVFSPRTYECQLCMITHDALHMKRAWKTFLEELDMPMEFLHRDQFHARWDRRDMPLPAILLARGDVLGVLMDAEAIAGCRTLAALQQQLGARLAEKKGA